MLLKAPVYAFVVAVSVSVSSFCDDCFNGDDTPDTRITVGRSAPLPQAAATPSR